MSQAANANVQGRVEEKAQEIRAPKKRRAQKLAEWVSTVDYRDFPEETTTFAKCLLLKTVAGMVAGSREPISRILTTYFADQGGTPEAGVVCSGYRTSVENAAYANATFAHGSELEDNEMPSITSAYWMFPALFPLAQKQTSSGKDLIVAAIVAWEISSRYNRAGPGWYLMAVHICPPTWFGPLGVAAASSKLLKLDATRTEHAITMSGSWACGLGQAGCDTHFLESGHTAKMGVQSALLAKAGATAELGVLEIPTGLYAPMIPNGQIDLSIIDKNIGEPPYLINQACIKKYSACTFAHTSVDAMGLIMRENNLTYDDIESVEARQSGLGLLATGCTPAPTDLQRARFSTHYLLAEVMLKGKISVATFEDLGALTDPKYLEAIAKVTTSENKELDFQSPGAELVVKTKSGKTITKLLEGWLGSPEHPLSVEEIRNVCRPYLEMMLDKETCDRVEEIVLNMEKQHDILELMDILTYCRVGRRA
jgi:2-methylcitrate dehydratase PrpD